MVYPFAFRRLSSEGGAVRLGCPVVTSINVRLQAFELGELFWEHDRLTLRSLNPTQRRAQIRARERMLRHAQKAQQLLESGAIPAGDSDQRSAVDGVADLMQQLLDHARDEESTLASAGAVSIRVPIPAPAGVWRPRPGLGPPAQRKSQPEPAEAVAMVCRLCRLPLERNALAAAMDRPMSQGWRHLDGRKTHLPEPVEACC